MALRKLVVNEHNQHLVRVQDDSIAPSQTVISDMINLSKTIFDKDSPISAAIKTSLLAGKMGETPSPEKYNDYCTLATEWGTQASIIARLMQANCEAKYPDTNYYVTAFQALQQMQQKISKAEYLARTYAFASDFLETLRYCSKENIRVAKYHGLIRDEKPHDKN